MLALGGGLQALFLGGGQGFLAQTLFGVALFLLAAFEFGPLAGGLNFGLLLLLSFALSFASTTRYVSYSRTRRCARSRSTAA